MIGLIDYISEAVSHHGRRYSGIDNLDDYTTPNELIDMLDELGYKDTEKKKQLDNLSFFEQGPSRYRLYKSNDGTRIMIKSEEALYDYISICFDKSDRITDIYLRRLDTSGNPIYSRADIKYVEEYILGKV